MECHREDQLGCPLQSAAGTFDLMIHVHMRCDLIKKEQEADSDHKTHGCRYERQFSHSLAALKRGLQQTPEGCGDHDTRRESGKNLLYVV